MAGFPDDLNKSTRMGRGLVQVILRQPLLIALPDKTYYYEITPSHNGGGLWQMMITIPLAAK
jgi:hypothetical protein